MTFPRIVNFRLLRTTFNRLNPPIRIILTQKCNNYIMKRRRNKVELLLKRSIADTCSFRFVSHHVKLADFLYLNVLVNCSGHDLPKSLQSRQLPVANQRPFHTALWISTMFSSVVTVSGR